MRLQEESCLEGVVPWIPPEEYAWLVALTQPGTLSVIGNTDQKPVLCQSLILLSSATGRAGVPIPGPEPVGSSHVEER